MNILPIIMGCIHKDKKFLGDLNKFDFSQWLRGFIDAEGNFQVFLDKGNRLRVMFRINLHIDDVDILYKIQKFLGRGTVKLSKTSCVYSLTDLSILINVLFPLLDQYKLLTTKWLDYLDFKSARVFLLNNQPTLTDSQLSWAKDLIKGMNSTRKSYNDRVIPSMIITPYWLLGFVEGEGTFGIKNMVPYFQVRQHNRNVLLMSRINQYLNNLPNRSNFTSRTVNVNVNQTVNKRTSVCTLSVNNVDTLFDNLLYFFIDMPFQTRKG